MVHLTRLERVKRAIDEAITKDDAVEICYLTDKQLEAAALAAIEAAELIESEE